MIKKLILTAFAFFTIGVSFAQVPRFENNFAQPLKSGGNGVFDIGIDRTKTLEENVRNLFYPASGGRNAGRIRDLLRTIGGGVLILYIIFAGVALVSGAGDEAQVKKAQNSLLYLVYGALLFFGASWLLGTALQINNPGGGSEALVFNIRNRIFFTILAILKGGAFFMAVIMLVYHGFSFMKAMEKEDQITAAKNGIMNVIISLIFIKVIDYIYFIASSDTGLFKSRAAELIVAASKFMGYILGITMIGAVFYAGFSLLTSNGKKDAVEGAKNTILNVFLSSLVIFLFLLIIYQMVNEFV